MSDPKNMSKSEKFQPKLRLRECIMGPHAKAIQATPAILNDFKAHFRGNHLVQVMDWWASAVEDGVSPDIKRFSPAVAPKAIPWTVLLHHSDDYALNLRIVGEAVRAAFNYSPFKNDDYTEFFDEESLPALLQHAQDRIVAGLSVPSLMTGDLIWRGDKTFPFQGLVLNYTHDKEGMGPVMMIYWFPKSAPSSAFF